MESSRINVLCERLIEAGWLMVVIFTPLLFNINTYRVFDADRAALLQTVVWIMSMAWIVRWIQTNSQRTTSIRDKLSAPLVLPTLALVLVQLLTTLTAISPYTSVFGSFMRPQGISVLLSCIVLFALLAQGLTTRAQLNRLLNTCILTSLPISLYAIIQNLNADPLVWDREIAGRVFATLGNPIFLGAYLLFVFFLTVGQGILRARAGALWQAGLYSGIAVIQAMALFFTVSRGPWVGWLAGMFLGAWLLAWALQWRRGVRGITLIGIVSIAAIGVFNIPNTPLEPLRNAPYIGSLGHLFEGTSGTGRVRTLLWEADARMFSERLVVQLADGSADRLHFLRPLVGYGPDAMATIFTQFRVPDGTRASLKEDHSHNETWDVLFSHGILGLLAYQWLWLSMFVLGLRQLGLLTTTRERNSVVALWLGGGAALGAAAIMVGRLEYLGIALTIGNLAGLGIFLAAQSLRVTTVPPANDPARAVLLATLLAILVAHYVEIQFGINLITTRTMFWVCAALLLALSSRRLELAVPAEPAHVPQTELRWTALVYAMISGMILVIASFAFIRFAPDANWWQILWQSLTFNPVTNNASPAVLLLVLATWLGAAMLETWECAAPGDRRRTFGLIASVSLAVALLFAVGYSMGVSALPPLPEKLVDLQEGIRTAEQFARLTDFFLAYWGLGFILIVAALMFPMPKPTSPRTISRWSTFGFPVLLVATSVASFAMFLQPIRADTYAKVGLFWVNLREPQAAILTFQRALEFAPLADRYYMHLGNAYANLAFYLDMKNPSQFGDRTQLNDILKIDATHLAALNRNDAIYAAQTMYLRAFDLNPLYVDHSVNLARLYKPEPPVNTPGKIQLAERATKYYAQAARLAPSDMELWNEWASFDVTYWENPDAALSKLHDAAQRDPLFAPTFIQMGDIYKSQSKPTQAITAYQRALAAKAPPAEAASKLAFSHYQQGNLNAAIAAYQQYIALAPDSDKVWEAHKNLAILYKQIGDGPAAIRHAELASTLAPAESRPQLNDLIQQWRNELQKPP